MARCRSPSVPCIAGGIPVMPPKDPDEARRAGVNLLMSHDQAWNTGTALSNGAVIKAPPTDVAEWFDQFTTSNGVAIPNLANAMVALRHAPALKHAIAYDEMLGAPILMTPLP